MNTRRNTDRAPQAAVAVTVPRAGCRPGWRALPPHAQPPTPQKPESEDPRVRSGETQAPSFTGGLKVSPWKQDANWVPGMKTTLRL